jgi:hypothetical protein
VKKREPKIVETIVPEGQCDHRKSVGMPDGGTIQMSASQMWLDDNGNPNLMQSLLD